jgi:NAD(P)-dependent dehydrogenase (short-subunit alcohol dehydrogenase family)
VAVTGRRQRVLEEAVESLKQDGITALGLQGDVRRIDDCNRWVSAAVERFASLNILVNCAAGARCLLAHARERLRGTACLEWWFRRKLSGDR